MTDRERLLRKLQASEFAAWELHMYLDTHKGDREACELYQKHCARAKEIKMEYERKYGPLTKCSTSTISWTADPWPWENEEEDC